MRLKVSVFKIKLALPIVILAIVVGFMAHGISAPTFADQSYNCWAYTGGSTSTGGCVGSPYGGSNFQVHEWCGWAMIEVSSPVSYAPPNKAVNATTGSCPFWSSGARTSHTTSS